MVIFLASSGRETSHDIDNLQSNKVRNVTEELDDRVLGHRSEAVCDEGEEEGRVGEGVGASERCRED